MTDRETYRRHWCFNRHKRDCETIAVSVLERRLVSFAGVPEIFLDASRGRCYNPSLTLLDFCSRKKDDAFCGFQMKN